MGSNGLGGRKNSSSPARTIASPNMVRGLSSFKKAANKALQDSGCGGSNTPGNNSINQSHPGLTFSSSTKDGSLTPVAFNKKKNLDIAKI